ncbi:hypothetical protein [Pectinatus frisingensis]|uniref:hypothetical protein n=1 Tax=Pectinatus frisingensis TaxID=865 RepID=UPI0018C6714E|nr:hypothetical protein [Pectinatus frisingensis]
MEKKINVSINIDAIKVQYDKHAAKCKEIAKEVNKWGKKTEPTLTFLKNLR